MLNSHAPHTPRPAAQRRGMGLLTIVTALFTALLAVACSKPGGLVILDPRNPARDYDIDLGQMQYGEVREHVVRMKNAEGRPVAISQVSAGCSCTSTRLAYTDDQGVRVEGPMIFGEQPFMLPKDAILEITLHVESKVVPSPNSVKRVIVRIQTDSEVDPSKTLEVHMFVEMPFWVIPKIINLGRVPIGGIAQGKTQITQALGTGELITGVLSKPDNMDVALETPEQIGSMMWRLNVRWFPPIGRGTQLRSIVLATTGADGQGEGRPLEIPVQAIGVEDIIAEPMLFSVPEQLEPNSGAGAVKLRSLVAGNRVFVTAVRVEGPQAESFRASAIAIEPDAGGRSENWMVQLTCNRPPQTSAAFSGSVVVQLDDPVHPEVRIPYLRKAR